MTDRKVSTSMKPVSKVLRGDQYPGIKGKVVAFAEHATESGTLYIHLQFSDKTEICWRIVSSLLIEEADLGDWTTGDFRQIRVYVDQDGGRKRRQAK